MFTALFLEETRRQNPCYLMGVDVHAILVVPSVSNAAHTLGNKTYKKMRTLILIKKIKFAVNVD